MCRLIELSRCRSFRCLTNLLAFGSVLSITSAFAEQPAGAVAKPAAKPTETRTQAHTESAAIPEWAEKINWFIRLMRAETQVLTIQGNTKEGFGRHDSDVQ